MRFNDQPSAARVRVPVRPHGDSSRRNKPTPAVPLQRVSFLFFSSFSCSVDPTHFTNFISFNIAALVFDQRVSLSPPSRKGCGAIHGEEKVAQPWRFIASSRSLFHAGANEVKQEKKSPVTLRVAEPEMGEIKLRICGCHFKPASRV